MAAKLKRKYILAFMDMAERFGHTSEAVRRKVGALLVKDGNPIAAGCNGTPPGHHTNCCEIENPDPNAPEEHKLITTPDVIHAEINCFGKLKSKSDAHGAHLYLTMTPCEACAEEIIDHKIAKVYYRDPYRITTGLDKLHAAGIETEQL